MKMSCVVRVFVYPPLLIDASRVRQREPKEVFDLSKCQDHRVRVSMLQVLIQRLVFAQHQWSFHRWLPPRRSPRLTLSAPTVSATILLVARERAPVSDYAEGRRNT